MADFEISYHLTLGKEGGYADHPYDSGGKTMYGITEKVARAHKYKGEMKDLPLDLAMKIYRSDYWEKLSLDLVTDQAIADFMFDAAVHCGTKTPARWLQENLNALNRCGESWPDIKEDGKIGMITLGILTRALLFRGTRDRILKLLVADRTGYYKILSRKNKKNEVFLGGWLDHRVNMPA